MRDQRKNWVDEAVRRPDPPRKIGRALSDLPKEVPPGARDVAVVTAWRAALEKAYEPVTTALENLARQQDWSLGYIVADTLDFNWRTAPIRHYASFQDFYDRELSAVWREWGELHKTTRKIAAGRRGAGG